MGGKGVRGGEGKGAKGNSELACWGKDHLTGKKAHSTFIWCGSERYREKGMGRIGAGEPLPIILEAILGEGARMKGGFREGARLKLEMELSGIKRAGGGGDQG